jgi:putative membrane protein insertion efficiency factor
MYADRMTLGPGQRLALGVIRLYQKVVSPALGSNCRYYPTCSHYAYEAIEIHGAARGSWLGLRRISRCHPWHEGGLDPVPGSPDALVEEGDAP